jgi:hypothetical protein
MTNPNYRYPLDKTGLSPDNKILGEQHTLINRQVRVFAPIYGAFFTESVVVRDVATGLALTRGSQYVPGELYVFPTGAYGKEICSVILIKDLAVSANVTIDYQVLGGPYSDQSTAIVAMLETLDLDDRPVGWGDIVGKPLGYNPASHFHDVGDVYGFEYVVHAIERVRDAILIGDVSAHDEIYRYIDAWALSIANTSDAVAADLAAHKARVDNPHATTKAQVGLGNVDNYLTATQAQAEAGASNANFMTPLRTAQAIAVQAGSLLAAHVSNVSNPHATTKAQVGLGNVDNFATATLVQAQAGTDSSSFMTPQRVAQAIATLAPTPSWSSITSKPTTVAGFGITDAMTTAWNVVAGDGMTGGGSGAANRTLTLGLPSTLTAHTSNSVGVGTHTHAITGFVSKEGDTMSGPLQLSNLKIESTSLGSTSAPTTSPFYIGGLTGGTVFGYLIGDYNGFRKVDLSGTLVPVQMLSGVTAGSTVGRGFTGDGSGLINIPYASITGAPLGAAPPGMIGMFAGNAVPAGWALANGQVVSRTTYAALFTAIGTTYGVGDGSTTFALPDMRGLFVRAWDLGRGVDPGRTLGSLQGSTFSSHAHGGATDGQGYHQHSLQGTVGDKMFFSGGGGIDGIGYPYQGTFYTSADGLHSHNIGTDAQGGSETRPINIALLFCVKV